MQSIVRKLSVLVAAGILLSGCASYSDLSGGGAEMAQMPITDQPTGRVYPGRIVWHDLLTPDPQLAGKFYQQLFGWQIDYQGKYAVVRNGGKLIAGILQVEPSESRAREGVWIPTVSVADVDKAVSRVKNNGGEILKGPVDMARRGRAALIRDPQSADLVLLSAKGGDPADTEAAIGDWLWDELWSRESDGIRTFYSNVLGYDEVVSRDKYDVLLTEGAWRAGIRYVEDDIEYRLWVPVVRVADARATTQRAVELGGVVWVTPDEAPGNGDTALISDPAGALLLVQRWPAAAAAGEY